MAFKFNPFTGTLDQTGSSSGGTGDVVGPGSATDNAIVRFDSTTGKLVQNSGATIDDSGNLTATNLTNTNSGDITLGSIGSSPDAKAATLSSQVLTLQPADATHPGVVSVGTQVLGGAKQILGATDAVHLKITGNATQTNDIFKVEKSDATLLLGVDHTNSRVKVRGLEFLITSMPIRIDSSSAPFVVTNGSASELWRMQSNGTHQSWGWYTYDSIGVKDTRIGHTSAANFMFSTSNFGTLATHWGTTAHSAGYFGIVNNLATNIIFVVKGISSQSANMTEWRNSSDTILASVNSVGEFASPNVVDKYADLTLNHAQILALKTTPVQIVAAPGAGFALVVKGMYATATFVTTAYTSTGSLSIVHGADVNTLSTVGTGVIEASASTAKSGAAGSNPIVKENSALRVYCGTTDPTETGTADTVLKVRVFYRIQPFPLP